MSRRIVGPILLLASAGVLGGVAWWVATHKGEASVPQSRPPFQVSVTLASVETGTLAPKAVLTGSVRSLQQARVGFDVAGRLTEVLVREGDVVLAGRDLARLDDSDRKLRLAQAQSGVTLAEKELALLEAGTRPEEIGRLEAQVRAAEADLAWTRGEVERMEPMRQGGVVSPSTFDSMVAQRNAANARREAALAALALARAGTRAEEIEVQRARVAQRQADVDYAEQEKRKTVLQAPFDAQVVRRLLAPGDAVNPGVAVLELADLGRREVELEVPASYIARLGDAGKAVVTVDEQPDFRLEAVLATQVLVADPRSGATRALIRLEPGGPDAAVLRPGTFVRAEVQLAPLVDRLLVPADAVRRTPQGWVLVKAVPPPPAGTPSPPGMPPMVYPPGALMAAFVPVRPLGTFDGRTAVEPLGAPLAAGDRVVVVGADMAFPGAPLADRGAAAPAGAPAAAGAEKKP